MNALLRFVKATVIGGMFFLVPLALIVVAIEKLSEILRPLAARAASVFGPAGIGALGEATIIGGVLFLATFLAGLFAGTIAGRSLFAWIEAGFLERIPGYGIAKSAAEEATGNVSRLEARSRSNAVFVRNEDGWQIGFVMDQVGEDLFSVYIPDAPSPTTGSVIFVGSDRFVDSGLRVADALRCLRQAGAGASRILGGTSR